MIIKNSTLFLLIILTTANALLSSQEQTHRVEKNETLYSIALNYNLSVDEIMSINDLEDNFIKEGDILTIPESPEEGIWIVDRGDSLSQIAWDYDITIEDLMDLNNLTSEKILIGQKLQLPLKEKKSRSYQVEPGDSLWNIAQLYNTTTDALLRINNLDSNRIIPGMELKLPIISSLNRGISVLKAMMNSPVNPEMGPWFSSEPESNTQLSLEYGELSRKSSIQNYDLAQDVMAKLNRQIDMAGRLSRDLRGWTIVLDPGHGGLDPGAVVQTTDGQGNSAFVVEDEYAYDIAIRVYALLKQHGADSDLTIISPNHHVRHTPDASLTFVNEKNEIFNSKKMNQSGAWSEWPTGGSKGLEKRLTVAEEIIENENNRKSLFISIHCDNTPGGFGQSGILIWGNSEEELQRSRDLAQAFDDSFPADLEIKEQELHVLGSNPATAGAILMEIRNVHYDNNSWALRNEDLRDQDANKIVNSILHFVETY